MDQKSKPESAVEVVSELIKAVPIYQDAVQPAAKEIGKALQTITKSIHLALTPIAGLVWGYEQIQHYLSEALTKRLAHVPIDRIITPSPVVAGPVLEALRFAGGIEELRDLYANLLAASMDPDSAPNAHPSFVEVIKNFTPDDARIMRMFAFSKYYPVIDIRAKTPTDKSYKYSAKLISLNHSNIGRLAKCERVDNTATYLDNLSRLGLCQIDEGELGAEAYEGIVDEKELEDIRKEIEKEKDRELQIVLKSVRITNFGIAFLSICLFPPHGKTYAEKEN